MDIGPADAKSFFQEGVLPVAADSVIGVGIGDIIKITANGSRIGTFVELFPDLLGLVCPMFKGIAEFFCNGFGSGENAVVHILYDLYIVKVLTPEEDGLEMGRRDPDRIIPDPDVGGNEAFGGTKPIGA